MIQEVRKSIHFIPYVAKGGRTKDDNPAPTVTLDKKRGRITFGFKALEQLGMINKFVAFYYEPTRKIIGWKVKDKLEEGQKVGKYSKWKLVKPFGKGKGFWVGGVKGIIKELNGGLKQDVYKNVEVKKYIETASVLDKGQIFFFIELKDNYSQRELIEVLTQHDNKE